MNLQDVGPLDHVCGSARDHAVGEPVAEISLVTGWPRAVARNELGTREPAQLIDNTAGHAVVGYQSRLGCDVDRRGLSQHQSGDWVRLEGLQDDARRPRPFG